MDKTDWKNDIGIQRRFGRKEDERIEFLEQYCKGKGIDIGCGRRAVKGAISYDIYPEFKPDVVGSAEKLEAFKDGELDYIVSSHCLEHLNDTKKVLKEWDRVVKVGGLIVILVPDSELKLTTITEPSHKVGFTINNIYQLFHNYLGYKIVRCNNPIEMINGKNKSDILCIAKKVK